MNRPAPLALAAVLLAAGCASPGPFPSLAPRDAERLYAAGDPLQTSPEAPDRAGLAGQVGSFVAAAAEGNAAFEGALAAARPLVARAGASGSESWIAAQQAVSRVEAARIATSRAVADLDQFALSQAKQGPLSAADYQRLTGAMAEVAAVAGRQQDAFDSLRSRLKGG